MHPQAQNRSYAIPTGAATTPRTKSQIEEATDCIGDATSRIHRLIARIYAIGDSIIGPSPVGGDGADKVGPPGLQGAVGSLNNAVSMLEQAVTRIDNN